MLVSADSRARWVFRLQCTALCVFIGCDCAPHTQWGCRASGASLETIHVQPHDARVTVGKVCIDTVINKYSDSDSVVTLSNKYSDEQTYPPDKSSCSSRTVQAAEEWVKCRERKSESTSAMFSFSLVYHSNSFTFSYYHVCLSLYILYTLPWQVWTFSLLSLV